MGKPEVIVTGGAGYIGSHTVVALQLAGYEVVVIDNLSNALPEVFENIKAITGIAPIFYKVDITKAEALYPVLEKHQSAVGVIHFAAFKAVGESVENPLSYYANNLGGLTTLLESMSRLKMDQLIFSSSCTVYGQPASLPVHEEAPIQPAISPYGNTKQIGEEILRDAVHAGLFKGVIALRYFNPVGADSSAKIGEVPLGTPNNLMPYITQTAMGIREALTVFGSDYPTPDGTAIRDYIHVSDLAAAHLLALERLIHQKHVAPFEVFNIGTGRGYSVLEVIRTFEEVNQLKLPVTFADRRAGDITQVWADPSRANDQLGWKPQFGLEDMVATAWAWEKYYRTLIVKSEK